MIYLREVGGQYVGPFKSRQDAERFVGLMEMVGEDWADSEVVEEDRINSITELKERIQ
jgi:hypothetical protein